MSTRHLFYALWPDNRQRDRLRDVINSVAKTVEGRPVERSKWHITLPWIGDVEEHALADLIQRTDRIEMEPFRLTFDRLEFWARPKVACLVAPTIPSELEQLMESLSDVVKSIGVTPPDRTYRPHITVSRAARAFTTERLSQRAVTEWSSFELMETVKIQGDTIYRPLEL